ncbi:hypothetical protein [Cellulomonas telluris]|uniref:hypothetical protein n=1 Tax=Cellulomonas telluris TaxID=2306636 RepID=UPI0010A7E690|nr:hypothetical protein [Cellulomonas telluris]
MRSSDATGALVHPSVVRLAEESGLRVVHRPDATVLEETEIGYTVARTPDGWTLTRRSRDRVHVEATSDVLEGVEVVLLTAVGPAWRAAHRLPALMTSTRGAPTPGAVPYRDVDGRWAVRWPGDHVVAGLGSIGVDTVVRVVGRDVDELVASYRHPDGLPLFPPAEPALG